jgi:DNA-binding IclR family transcriptional regulator
MMSSFDPDTQDEAGEQQLVHAVQRAVSILRCFTPEKLEWSAAELVKHSGLRRTTALRLAKTLEAEGFLSSDPETGKYSLGPFVHDISYVLRSDAHLAWMATPHMERLAEIVGASAGLTVWSGDGPLCIAHSPSPRPFAHMMTVGRRLHDMASGHAKVLLAFGPESRRARYLARPIEPRTPYTTIDSNRAREEFEQIRVEGVARDLQGHTLGVVALAAPVWDSNDHVRASLSIVMSEAEYGLGDDRVWVQALKQIAADISYDLGYRGNLDQASPAKDG